MQLTTLMKGKIERFFLTLQKSFEQSLVFDKVTSLEQLNSRLWQWIEQGYHQQVHSSLGDQSPAQRYRERSDKVRCKYSLAPLRICQRCGASLVVG